MLSRLQEKGDKVAPKKVGVGIVDARLKEYQREEFVEAVVAEFDWNLSEGRTSFKVELDRLPGVEWMFWLEPETLDRIRHIEGGEAFACSVAYSEDRHWAEAAFWLKAPHKF